MQRLAVSAVSGGLRFSIPKNNFSTPKSFSHLQWSQHRLVLFSKTASIPQISRRKIATSNPNSVPPAPVVPSPPPVIEAPVTVELHGNKMDISNALFEASSAQVANSSAGITSILDWWQPVAWMTQLLENVHSFTGLPWWSAIIVHAFLLRTFLLPGNVVSLRASAKMAKAKPELERLQKQMQGQAVLTGQRPSFLESQAQMKEVYDRHDVKMWKMSLPPLLSAPFFITMFLAIRRMAEQNPTLSDGGWWWFTDLAMSDPWGRLPLISASLMMLSFQVGMDGNPGMAERAAWIKWAMRGAAAASVPFTMWFPQALHVYWIANTLYSLMVTMVTRIPAVKRWIGFPPATIDGGKPKPIYFKDLVGAQQPAAASPTVTSTTAAAPSAPLIFARPKSEEKKPAAAAAAATTPVTIYSRPQRSKKS